MSHDEQLAARVRQSLANQAEVSERRMMGALCFMAGEHMCCGVTGPRLMVRVGPEAYPQALSEPHVEPMRIGTRPTTGFVLVAPEAIRTGAQLARWIERALRFVSTLPPN